MATKARIIADIVSDMANNQEKAIYEMPSDSSQNEENGYLFINNS